MNKTLRALLPLLFLWAGWARSQSSVPMPGNVHVTRASGLSGQSFSQVQQGYLPLGPNTAACGPDTVLYPLAKATNYTAVALNAPAAPGLGQWYPVPQTLTIRGFSFYAWVDSLTNQTIPLICEVFAAGADSLPTGSYLARDTVYIDSNFYGGNLNLLMKHATFTVPATVNPGNGYVVTITNSTQIAAAFVLNDYNAIPPDGGQEWLSCVFLTPSWVSSRNLTLGGTPLDCDALIYPHVTYNLTAGFSPINTTGCSNSPVSWTNTSSAILQSRFYSQYAFLGTPNLGYTWNYGDGSPTANAYNTSHSYSTAGTYTVSLRDTIIGWTSYCVDVTSGTATIATGSPVSANFNSTPSNLVVNFGDLSTGTPIAWSWTFGDGGTSTLQNPTHTYAAAGTYNVCLIASNSCGADTFCSAVTVTSCAPVAAFTYGTNFLTVNFTDGSSASPTSWAWDFGDGATSTSQNPSHTYATAGMYQVCLTVTNACGSNTICHNVLVNCPLPSANFTSSVNTLNVNFSNTSTGSPTSYSWSFGDGGTSTATNPTHTYATSGTYTVCLTATNACGSDSTCHTVVAVCPTPAVSFNFLTTGNVVAFTDQTPGTNTGYFWDFGDGSSSMLQNPNHTYAATGNYTVCLTVTNACGADTLCRQVIISCVPPSAGFNSSVVNDSTHSFTSTSSANAQFFSWNFGDGTTSTLTNPVHTFPAAGTYNVCLTVTNACGSSTICHSVTVTCSFPTAGYSFNNVNGVTTFTDNSILPQTWSWDFGDGTTSNLQNPVHSFTQSGTYQVCLTVGNFCGTNTTCQNVVVVCNLPTANFSYSNGVGVVDFTDLSSNAPNAWIWNFGDGTTSTQQNPSHGYLFMGNYWVCLRAFNNCGNQDTCIRISVSTIGLEDQALQNSLQIFPNPNNGQFELNAELPQASAYSIEVANLLGVAVLRREGNSQGNLIHEAFDLSQLAAGVYSLEVIANGQRATRKVIIR